ncbi:MAG: DUF2514 family protein [Burkholderiales bacterium]|nr:DUF2514 family protein [Burkholderiales bacterium]MDE2452736.1 DUF2514 family protein [Burkholderiales bacterium]
MLPAEWKLAGLLAVLLALVISFGALLKRQADLGSTRQQAADAVAAAAENARHRATEAQHAAQVQEAITNGQAQLDAVAAASGRALDALARLRQRARVVARQCPVPDLPAAAAASPAASAPGDLLADVLGRMGEAGRQLALEADERRATGLICEQSYPVTQGATP